MIRIDRTVLFVHLSRRINYSAYITDQQAGPLQRGETTISARRF